MGEVSIKVEVEPDMEVVQFVLPEVKVEVEDGSKEILDEIPTEPQGSFLKNIRAEKLLQNRRTNPFSLSEKPIRLRVGWEADVFVSFYRTF